MTEDLFISEVPIDPAVESVGLELVIAISQRGNQLMCVTRSTQRSLQGNDQVR